MTIYLHTPDIITFDDGKETWLTFARTEDGGVLVDRSMEPVMTAENVQTLVGWLNSALKETRNG